MGLALTPECCGGPWGLLPMAPCMSHWGAVVARFLHLREADGTQGKGNRSWAKTLVLYERVWG